MYIYPSEGGRRFAPQAGCQSLYPACLWARGVRRRGRSGADPGLRVCVFVFCLSRLVWWGCEFRGKDRTKRFRRARSTKSEREVGSDSLISATSPVGILGAARNQAGWARGNPVRGCVPAVGHLNKSVRAKCSRHMPNFLAWVRLDALLLHSLHLRTSGRR